MSSTQGRFEQRSPFTDGVIPIPLGCITFTSDSGTAPAIVRTAAGNWGISLAASSEAHFNVELAPSVFRTGLLPFLQEQFGTAAGVAGPTSVANTTDPFAQPVNPGFPPFTGATQLSPVAGFVPKGIQVNNFTVAYNVATSTLTTFNCTIEKTTYVNATAVAVSHLLTSTGLTKTFAATPYLGTLTPTTPAFNVTDNSIISIDMDVVTPASSVFTLLKVFAHVSFNFN
jgi:hypothetical protein